LYSAINYEDTDRRHMTWSTVVVQCWPNY